MSHTVEINASEHTISSVTVYQRRAEVVRNFVVELEAGQSEVQIIKLPTCIDESSLRVDGLGNAVIFDVIYERLTPERNVPKASSEKVQELETQLASFKRELKVLQSQTKVLDDFSHTLTAKDVNPAELVYFLDILSERGGALNEKVEETQSRIRVLEIALATVRRGQSPGEEVTKLATKVTVVVLAEQSGKAELTVTYVVSNADWSPSYDLRATVDSTGKNATFVSLNYRASITQTTGEDWKDVALSLSTTSPLVGAHIPQLTPQRIGAPFVPAPMNPWPQGSMVHPGPGSLFFSPGGPVPGMAGGAPSTAFGMPTQQHQQQMQQVARMQQGLFAQAQQQPVAESALVVPPPNPFMAIPVAQAREGAISANFFIEGLSSIPSDGTTHKVAIAVLDLTAKLEWIAVPKLNTSAFLQCQITNSSTYVLLAGPSNIFLDGSFVAKSRIPYASPQDTFPCSVGVDPAIRITYPPVSKRARTQATGTIFNSSKLDSTVFTQRIGIKNTRQSSVKLFVRDQVPVSEDQKFKVTVLEPKDLGLAKAGEEVNLSKEAICYWARKDWDVADRGTVNGTLTKVAHKSSQSDVPDGQVEWVVTLAPGKGTELVLSWEIAAPQGEKWETR
ncbi:hypothetical protein CALCODRAFT_463690 [Calocera cornea HHB12733]|uniref:Mucoidy inhibitor A n=1 Tax=Calocera cornea HHB12733 TaxID=1353952 RepID=A0A165JIC2_9BASI|nr:hypothetical protein CALCODRAFT_463690 [Calocera cornea HHB12733]